MTLHPLPPLPASSNPLRRQAGGPEGRLQRPAAGLLPSRPAPADPQDGGAGPKMEAEHRWSCWTTSSLSLVSLAGLEDEPLGSQPRRHPCRVSPRTCINHLLDSAPAAGLSLFCRFTPVEPGSLGLIFGPQPEITTVLQDPGSGRLLLPLAVLVQPQADGGCELRLPDTDLLHQLPLPGELLNQVSRLMRLVDRYLH